MTNTGGSVAPEPADRREGEARRLDKRALRASSGPLGRLMLIAFGIGIGIAASVAVVDSPDEFRTVRVEGGAEAIDGASAQPGEAGTEGGTRTITQGPTGGSQVQGAASGPGAGGGGGPEEEALNPKDYKCEAGKNGGATDKGVSANAIKVSANVVTDGPGKSFLEEAVIGMRAVVDAANLEGICGRKILLETRNDSWDESTGLQYIENYAQQDVFALLVNPSSEGLSAAIKNGTIDRHELPVVGSDGMLISQYRWPEDSATPGLAEWVWPVAASTVSTMHIIVEYAAQQGAKSFALVYDKFYKFGPEGEKAFRGAYERLESQYGFTSIETLGIEPGQTDYDSEAQDRFNKKCMSDGEPTCDLVAMLLTSSDAQTWIKSRATFGKDITAGPQTLFNRRFAENCVALRNQWGLDGKECDLVVFTGYNPPVGELANVPDVNRYVNDVKARNATADTDNSFTQGAYLGTRLFIEALERVGPNLTRENLRAVLDSMTLKNGLVHESGLTWTPGNHFANVHMQGFRVGQVPGQFTGWVRETPWIKDKNPTEF